MMRSVPPRLRAPVSMLVGGAVIAAIVHLAIAGRSDVVVLDPPKEEPATV